MYLKEPTLCPNCGGKTVPSNFTDHISYVCVNENCKHSWSVRKKELSTPVKRNTGNRLTDEDRERIIKVYKNCLIEGMKKGKAQDFIAANYHHSKVTVYKVLKANGLIGIKNKKEKEPEPKPTKPEKKKRDWAERIKKMPVEEFIELKKAIKQIEAMVS